MKKLFLFTWMMMLSIVAMAQTIMVIDKDGNRIPYDLCSRIKVGISACYERDECFSAPEYGDKLRINNHWYKMTDKYFTFDGSESVCVVVVEPYDPERGNLI